MARAYKIGPKEAAAIVQLTQHISKPVISLLKQAVSKRGMRGFLTHEGIGKEIFNLAWTSGSGMYEQWHDQLTNKDDDELVARRVAIVFHLICDIEKMICFDYSLELFYFMWI